MACFEQRPFDFAAAEARMADLAVLMMALLSRGQSVLKLAQLFRRDMRRSIHQAEQARRYKIKLHMLRLPDWRMRVIQDLGGIDKLFRLWRRRADRRGSRKIQKRHSPDLSPDALQRRAQIKQCAVASAHPLIKRDPFKVDREGQFRLPPLPRCAVKEGKSRPRDYYYDARPVTKLTGFKTPITVWPEEFFVFIEWEVGQELARKATVKSKRRYDFVQKWVAALLAEAVEERACQPVLKIKTARAPPY